MCQEYYQSEGVLLQGTGVSFPVVVTIDDTTGNISHLDHPSDVNYIADIERLFPKSMAKRILKPGYVFTPNLRSEAESYFAEQPQK